MKRVVLFKQELAAKGGLEKATLRIANAFVEKGCAVTIVTATPEALCPALSNIRIVSFPISAWLRHKQLHAWDEICRSYLIHHPTDISLSFDRTTPQSHIRAGNGIHAAYLQQRALQVSNFKKASFSFNPLHRTLLRLEKEAFANPNLRRVIVNSAMVRQEAINLYQVDPTRLSVIHNGVEWSELTPHFENWPSLRQEVALEIGSDPTAFHFLFAGHEYARKGLDHLLAGLAHLKNSFCRLIVIGRDKNISKYKRIATDLGLKHVYFLGPRKDLYRFYALADVCIIPSLYDPFANVTVEALAMGLYVISSRYNGGAEVLDETRGAIIPHLHDVNSVANSLEKALQYSKTQESAAAIRYSVRFLDYPLQLERFTTACLS